MRLVKVRRLRAGHPEVFVRVWDYDILLANEH